MVFILVHYRGMKFHRGEVNWGEVVWEKGHGYRVEFQNGQRKHSSIMTRSFAGMVRNPLWTITSQRSVKELKKASSAESVGEFG